MPAKRSSGHPKGRFVITNVHTFLRNVRQNLRETYQMDLNPVLKENDYLPMLIAMFESGIYPTSASETVYRMHMRGKAVAASLLLRDADNDISDCI